MSETRRWPVQEAGRTAVMSMAEHKRPAVRDKPPAPAGRGASSGKPVKQRDKSYAKKKKRRGKRGSRAGSVPVTPEEVIRRKRRRCADAEDIVSFFTRLAAMAVLLVLLFGFVFGVTPMADDDMSPRISAGDLLLYYRLADDYVSGDVMVFQKDGEQYVGRVVARGGDTVEVTEEATLVIDGSTVLETDIYYSTPRYENGPEYPVTLAEGEYFILCDYREGARDSRYFGPVSRGEVEGKVITVIRRSGL